MKTTEMNKGRNNNNRSRKRGKNGEKNGGNGEITVIYTDVANLNNPEMWKSKDIVEKDILDELKKILDGGGVMLEIIKKPA